MKVRLLLIAVFAALVSLSALGTFMAPLATKAQDQLPPPVNDRVSFGLVGITAGQTVRISVANTIMSADVNLPPGPTRVTMNFRYMNGNLVRDSRTGQV